MWTSVYVSMLARRQRINLWTLIWTSGKKKTAEEEIVTLSRAVREINQAVSVMGFSSTLVYSEHVFDESSGFRATVAVLYMNRSPVSSPSSIFSEPSNCLSFSLPKTVCR